MSFNSIHRQFFFLALALIWGTGLPAKPLLAQQVGSYVIVLEDADILSGADPVEHVTRGMALLVRGSRPGGWLWVTRHANGWVPSKKVVPVQTALDYLTAEISQQPLHAPLYNDRATVQFETGNYAGALRDYTTALQLFPDSAALLANRAVTYFELNQFDNAVTDLDAVARLNPDEAQSYIDRGWALYHDRRYDAALADYEKALELDPDSWQAVANLAWLRATCPAEEFRDGVEALKLAEQACEMTEREEPFALATLAAAQAELEDYPTAVETQTKALEIAPYTRRKLYRERLAFYTANQPYRLGGKTPVAKAPSKTAPAKSTNVPQLNATAKPQPKIAKSAPLDSVLVPNKQPADEVSPADENPTQD